MKVLMESITTISAMVALLAEHIGGFCHEFVWFGERYSFKKGGRERRFFLASLLFALHSTVSLTALHGMNIPMYSAIKVFKINILIDD